MTTLYPGITDVPLVRKRSVMAFASAVVAVAGFVAISLVLQSVARLAIERLGMIEDTYGQCVQFILVTAASMYAIRKIFDKAGINYSGKLIFGFFLATSVIVMAFAMSSGLMKVDFIVSLLQMSALCLFAYLQFGAHHRR